MIPPQLLTMLPSLLGKGGGGGSTPGSGGQQAALSLATGALQTLQANRLKRQSDASAPDLVDPNQSSYLAELNQKRKSIATGADFASGMQAADTTQAGTNDAILRAAGGDSGGAIQGLLQAQSVAGNTKNQVLSQGQQQQVGYDNLYGNLMNQISGRKLQLQQYRTQQKLAEATQKQQFASQNLNAGLGRLLSGGQQGQQSPGMVAPNANSLLGKPALGPTEGITMQEGGAPPVVPLQNLATLGLGAAL